MLDLTREAFSDGEPDGLGGPAVDLPGAMLRALAAMAVRSKRRQADLGVALRRSGLPSDRVRVADALRQLIETGFVDSVIPLSDGGILVSVTGPGLDCLGRTTLTALGAG